MQERAESPCISVCRLDDQGVYCVGCLRTLDEVRRWSLMDNDGRLRVLKRIREATKGSDAATRE